MPTLLVPPPSPALGATLEALRQRLDARLVSLLPRGQADDDLIGAAMVAAALSPGKRVRPLLLMLVTRELGGDEARVLDLGCALELVHAASLVLDDMPCMDDARLRRGQPTVHVRFGEDVAVLASVALLSRAFGVVAASAGLTPLARAELVGLLSDAVGEQGLVRGQYEDLRAGRAERPVSEVAGTNHLKTGALFCAALEMAAVAAGADRHTRRALRETGIEMGQAFQLYDDLRDGETGGPADKDRGKDAGKSTLVALLGPEAARHRLRHHVQRIEAQLQGLFGPDSAPLQLLRGLFPPLR